VSAEGRLREARFRMDATPGDLAAGVPIVVLVNGSSASAAEILAAALSQNGRATAGGPQDLRQGHGADDHAAVDGRGAQAHDLALFHSFGCLDHGIGITPDVELHDVETAPAAPDAPDSAPTLARRDTQVAAALAELRGGASARALHRSARRF